MFNIKGMIIDLDFFGLHVNINLFIMHLITKTQLFASASEDIKFIVIRIIVHHAFVR